MVDWSQLWQIVFLPAFSGALGYLQNVAEDGISAFEWRETVKTVLLLGIPGLFIWLGLDGFGVDVSALTAVAVPVAVYWLFRLWPVKTGRK